jgi:hypothetical protein
MAHDSKRQKRRERSKYLIRPDGVWCMANIPWLRTVLTYAEIPQITEVSYCYYKLVTNIIGAVKINVLSCPWYTV